MARLFSEVYQALLNPGPPQSVREAQAPSVSELVVQRLWYDQAFQANALRSVEGHRIEVVSPGFWNHQAGPDFLGAQLLFNGELHAGDVEIHLSAGGWRAHGHHRDARYDQVVLHVVFDNAPGAPAVTSAGRRIPTLLLDRNTDPALLADDEDAPSAMDVGACAALLPVQGTAPLLQALRLAGEWRMLAKARAFQLRAERAGPEQALYEIMLYACGFSAFKHQFQAVARHLPYERAVQLAQADPLLLECALLQLAGLLPESLAVPVPHFQRLSALRTTHLETMKSLPLVWPRGSVRPANNPERRLAGMARVIARTARDGLLATVMDTWRDDLTPLERRRRFEKLFPGAMGFWSTQYTWTSKPAATPAAPIGPTRVRSIIGNVLVPVALAEARQRRDRALEERVLAFYEKLPKEAANHVVDRMLPRLWGHHTKVPPITFQLQQGMLQFHHDWCGPNPSCRNCTMHRYLNRGSC